MSDAQLFAAQKKSVADLIASNLNRGNQLAGLWFGRDNGKVAIALAFGERQVQLDEIPMRADAKGHVKIRGEVLIHLSACKRSPTTANSVTDAARWILAKGFLGFHSTVRSILPIRAR